MSRAQPYPRRRLVLLAGLLLVSLGALVAQRAWFSEAARAGRLERLSLDQLEKQAAASRDPGLQYHLARRRLEAGDPEGARGALEATLRLDPHFRGARATLGTLLLGTNQDQEAYLQLQQAVRDDPADLDAFLGLALLFQRNEAWQKQEQAAEAATRIQPRNPNGWILLGQAADARRDRGRAATCFERAMAVAPKDARPYPLAARARLRLGELDRAEQHARAGIQADPQDPGGYLALGEVLLRRERARLPEAEQALEQAVALGERSGEAYVGLARALQLQGRPAEAEPQYRLALRARPDHNPARYGLARALRAQGKRAAAAAVDREFQAWVRFEERRSVLHDQVALHPDDARRWFALARLNVKMGLWEAARRQTLSGLRRAPADPAGTRLMEAINRHAGE
jgi:tetratricopeptide (TPR) repeat protein